MKTIDDKIIEVRDRLLDELYEANIIKIVNDDWGLTEAAYYFIDDEELRSLDIDYNLIVEMTLGLAHFEACRRKLGRIVKATTDDDMYSFYILSRI